MVARRLDMQTSHHPMRRVWYRKRHVFARKRDMNGTTPKWSSHFLAMEAADFSGHSCYKIFVRSIPCAIISYMFHCNWASHPVAVVHTQSMRLPKKCRLLRTPVTGHRLLTKCSHWAPLQTNSDPHPTNTLLFAHTSDSLWPLQMNRPTN